MNTDAILKSSVRLSVAFEGQAPIDSSAILWESSQEASITNTSGEVFCKRIRYADLTAVSTDRVFAIYYANGNFSVSQGVLNTVGEYMDIETPLSLMYLKTNVAAAYTSVFPLAASIPADTEFLHRGSIAATEAYTEADPVMTITWDNSAILAIGSSNFYCDLILANS